MTHSLSPACPVEEVETRGRQRSTPTGEPSGSAVRFWSGKNPRAMSPSMRRLRPLVLCFGLFGCETPPEGLKTWKPSDHTNRGDTTAAAQNRPRQSTGEPRSSVPGLDEVTLAAWKSNCTVCHGSMGRGDGPQAPMFKPKDLTDPTWQASVNDEQIYEVIQKGRNKMPAFALPEQVARNLVQLIRLLGGNRSAAPTTSGPSPSGAPGTAAAGSATATTAPGASSAKGPTQRTAQPSPAAAGTTSGAAGHGSK